MNGAQYAEMGKLIEETTKSGALVLTGGSTLAKTAVVLLTISLLVALRQRKRARYTRRPELEKLLRPDA